MIDRAEYAVHVLLQDPDRACAGTVKNQVVELAASVVIESEDAVGGRLEIVAADAIARIG